MSSTNHIQPSASTADAIQHGYFHQVRYLLEFGHQPNERITAPHSGGHTALMLCSMVQDEAWATSLARTLLEKGARVGLRDQKAGLNALHYACIYRRRELVPLFLRAIDCPPNAKDRFGNTALHHAAAAGDEEIVRQLVHAFQQYDFPLDEQNKEGLNALMCAWLANSIACGDFLKSVQKVDERKLQAVHDVDGKTCGEYERESRARVARKEESEEDKRQRRTLRFYEADAWRQHQNKMRARKSGNVHHQTWKELQRDINKTKSVYVIHKLSEDQVEARPATAMITPASELDVKNIPRCMFPVDAVSLFSSNPPSTVTSSQQARRPPPHLATTNDLASAMRMKLKSTPLIEEQAPSYTTDSINSPVVLLPNRPKSTLSSNTTLTQQYPRLAPTIDMSVERRDILPSRTPCASRTANSNRSKRPSTTMSSWRDDVNDLFQYYENQLSSNYRATATPYVPDPADEMLKLLEEGGPEHQSHTRHHIQRRGSSSKNITVEGAPTTTGKTKRTGLAVPSNLGQRTSTSSISGSVMTGSDGVSRKRSEATGGSKSKK